MYLFRNFWSNEIFLKWWHERGLLKWLLSNNVTFLAKNRIDYNDSLSSNLNSINVYKWSISFTDAKNYQSLLQFSLILPTFSAVCTNFYRFCQITTVNWKTFTNLPTRGINLKTLPLIMVNCKSTMLGKYQKYIISKFYDYIANLPSFEFH
jgi:hypothetical protein